MYVCVCDVFKIFFKPWQHAVLAEVPFYLNVSIITSITWLLIVFLIFRQVRLTSCIFKFNDLIISCLGFVLYFDRSYCEDQLQGRSYRNSCAIFVEKISTFKYKNQCTYRLLYHDKFLDVVRITLFLMVLLLTITKTITHVNPRNDLMGNWEGECCNIELKLRDIVLKQYGVRSS